jgi:hypothetical protein
MIDYIDMKEGFLAALAACSIVACLPFFGIPCWLIPTGIAGSIIFIVILDWKTLGHYPPKDEVE